jgi:fructose-bisphosphate aldolase class I
LDQSPAIVKANTPEATIRAILDPGKGILAADESLPTIDKRFKSLGIANTEENRRAYREMLFTSHGLGESISGVILFDETIRQKTSRGALMPELLAAQGIVPGIKVDEGAVALPAFAGEKMTLGLDQLRGRLAEYSKLGALFTKWRAVIAIGDSMPTGACIEANANSLALFAALSQEAGMVPIVEPEVLMDGDHTIARCEEVMGATLEAVFDSLSLHRVVLEKMLLKSGMVLSGEDCPEQAGVPEVADATLRCFRRFVPAAVPGIVFLSGGQSEAEATQRLNAICAVKAPPWKLTFSFGRALQDPAMKAWGGSPGNVPAAQDALAQRARLNGLAVQGSYSERLEKTGSAA